MATASDLVTLGWRNVSAQSIKDFQRAWNLGPRLAADGVFGPKTRSALDLSLARKSKGLPDISANFSAKELACECGGRYADCRRIWTPAVVIAGLEVLRTKFGPFSPDRAGRCPGQNRAVGGAPKSLHLTGEAVDIPVFKYTVAQMRSLGLWSGIGFYDYGPEYCRHVDMRHLRGFTAKPSRPTLWEYPGAYKHVPKALNPGGALAPAVPKPSTPPAIPKGAFLHEDGIADPTTIRAFARMWGVKNPAGTWTETNIKAMQRWARVRQDGVIGPKTVAAVQKRVYMAPEPWSYAWTDKPTNTTRALEAMYNRGVRAQGHGY